MWNILCNSSMVLFSQLSFEYSVQICQSLPNTRQIILICINAAWSKCDLCFAYNGQNYARYFTFFPIYMLIADELHPGAGDLKRITE